MEEQTFKMMFEPDNRWSPELNVEDYTDTSDDEVEFVGTYLNENIRKGEVEGELTNIKNITLHLEKMATVLATPPMSPQEDNNNLPPTDMPSLRAMLSNNHSGCTPTGYIVHIPCFLCQLPFSTIDSLREHLTMHAKQLNMPLINDRPIAQPVLPTELFSGAPLISMSTQHARSIEAATPAPPAEPMNPLTCPVCGRELKSELGLTLHVRVHYNIERKKRIAKAFKCHLCKKSYRRHANLLKHMTYRHGIRPITEALPSILRSTLEPALAATSNPNRIPALDPVAPPPANAPTETVASPAPPAAPTETAAPPASLPTFPRPIQPTPPSEDDEQNIKPIKRFVWSTKLLNAVAAASYDPASEPAAKYMAPTEETNRGQQQLSIQPKQKYALRSPFCNPNLWVDYDNHIP